jgi:murein endopeptidase
MKYFCHSFPRVKAVFFYVAIKQQVIFMHISNILGGNLYLMSSNPFSCHISHFHMQLVVFLTTYIFTCSESLLDTC